MYSRHRYERRSLSLALGAILLAFIPGAAARAQHTTGVHPEPSGDHWSDLFAPDLSDAGFPRGTWSLEDGILTATEDEVIWSARSYERFILDLEFRNAPGSNSGVIIYASDRDDWIPNSIEIQIADDYHEQWAAAPPSWRAGAVFGHQAPTRSVVFPPGEWNRMTITAIEDSVWVMLNGDCVIRVDLKQWTSAETNPDGTVIPSWLSRPLADLPRGGHVGFQGKHGDAPIWFRNIRIRELDSETSPSHSVH